MRERGETDSGVVYVIDDDADVRSSIRALLEEIGLRVESFETVDEFRAHFDPRATACLILDVRLPGTSGLVFQKQMLREGIELPVLVITGHGDVQMAVEALRNGAFDFIEKPYRPQQLLDRIQDALDASSRSQRARAEQARLREAWARLTKREVVVARELLTGDAHTQIAQRLGVTSQAIDGHRTRIFRKLEVSNLAEMVRLAMRIGVESPHRPDASDGSARGG